MKWFTAALVASVVTGLALLLLPGTTEQTPAGTVTHRLIADEGAWVAVTIAALVCAFPLLTPARVRAGAGVAAAVVLLAGIVVSILSVGVFCLPALVLLVVGAARSVHRGS